MLHHIERVRCALTLVIFEVISWYETIVREISQPQREKTTDESSSWSSSDETYGGGTTSRRARSASTGSSLSITGFVPTVSIGNMQLHRADAKNVLVYLVLSRIRKVRGIVKSLSTDCNMSLGGVERLDSVTDECLKLQKEENRL